VLPEVGSTSMVLPGTYGQVNNARRVNNAVTSYGGTQRVTRWFESGVVMTAFRVAVPAGVISPFSSASAIMENPMRSLTEQHGSNTEGQAHTAHLVIGYQETRVHDQLDGV